MEELYTPLGIRCAVIGKVKDTKVLNTFTEYCETIYRAFERHHSNPQQFARNVGFTIQPSDDGEQVFSYNGLSPCENPHVSLRFNFNKNPKELELKYFRSFELPNQIDYNEGVKKIACALQITDSLLTLPSLRTTLKIESSLHYQAKAIIKGGFLEKDFRRVSTALHSLDLALDLVQV